MLESVILKAIYREVQNSFGLCQQETKKTNLAILFDDNDIGSA